MSLSLLIIALLTACWLLFAIAARAKILKMDNQKVERRINKILAGPKDGQVEVGKKKRLASIRKVLIWCIVVSFGSSLFLVVYSFVRSGSIEASVGKVAVEEILLWSAGIISLSGIYLLGLFVIVSAMINSFNQEGDKGTHLRN